MQHDVDLGVEEFDRLVVEVGELDPRNDLVPVGGQACPQRCTAASVCPVSSSSTTQLVAPSTRISRRATSIGARRAVSS